MANFISLLPVVLPLFNNHMLALFDLQWVKLIIYVEELSICIFIAKGQSSGQYVKKNGLMPVHFVKI